MHRQIDLRTVHESNARIAATAVAHAVLAVIDANRWMDTPLRHQARELASRILLLDQEMDGIHEEGACDRHLTVMAEGAHSLILGLRDEAAQGRALIGASVDPALFHPGIEDALVQTYGLLIVAC